MLGGILAAPFTAGASLVLTVGGIAGGVASAGTTITADIIKNGHIQTDSGKIKSTLAHLQPMDKVVNKLITELQAKMLAMRKLAANDPSISNWFKDTVQVTKWIKGIGWNVGYGGYQVQKNLFKKINSKIFLKIPPKNHSCFQRFFYNSNDLNWPMYVNTKLYSLFRN
jgi:ribosomal protein L17